MFLDITVKNYRCFPDAHPLRLSLRKGFTAFVGPNNSGKSSILKFFVEFRNLFSALGHPDSFRDSLLGSPRAFNFNGISDFVEVFSNANDRDLAIELSFTPEPTEALDSQAPPITQLDLKVLRDQNVFQVTRVASPNGTMTQGGAFSMTTDTRLTSPAGHIVTGTHAVALLASCASTTYLGSFRNAINVGGDQPYFDIQVGQQFLRTWKRFKTGTEKRQANAAYRLTEDIRHVFGFAGLEINTSDDDRSLQVFVNGRSFRLDELGSGLSQFILVLASVATRRQDFILIDEPELNLHPSLQLDFLTTIASYAREGTLFGTHSIGLARAVGQRIYALRKLREGESDMRLYDAMPRLAEFLGELSFSGYRELGFKKALFVEGPTDVTTMQQFLRRMNKDHLIVVLPLGGSSMITGDREHELAEVRRITDDISIIIDSERTNEAEALAPDRQAFRDSCEKLGITCHVLDRRAIENYFPERAIRIVKGDSYRALGPFEILRDVSPAWAKAENWRIAREMTPQELDATDLGAFLASL